MTDTSAADEARPRNTWVNGLIKASAQSPLLTVVVIALLAFSGLLALRHSPLDALPDLSDVQVIISTEWPGQSPDIIEDQVTYPITSALLGAPRIKSVRGQSFFGLSFVYVIFEEDVDLYWARSRVLESLNTIEARLPAGVHPQLGPDATGLGWVFQYALVDRSGNSDLGSLRTFQDWTLRYALESVPGVAEVASLGGFQQQLQISVDPIRMRAFKISLQEVLRAIQDSNGDTGGRVMELAGHEYMLRSRGRIQDVGELAQIPLTRPANGRPVLLQDIAEIQLGPDIRRGIAELDGDGEVVGGIVVMRQGENALAVIDRVKQRLNEMRSSLPPGVEWVVTYDRSQLIEESLETLSDALIEEMIIVGLVIFVFLLHFRSVLVPVLSLPIAVLLSFIPMYLQGVSINLMSLGGIAVALGAMVDAAIVMLENVHKHLETWEAKGRHTPRTTVVIEAMQEVGPSLFFSLLVMTVSFLPVFALQEMEGRLFTPLAYTKIYSMGFAACLAVTLTPALVVLLLRGHARQEQDHVLIRLLARAYAPCVRFAVRQRLWVIAGALCLLVATIPLYQRLSSEFMPPLEEGAILYMPSAPPGMSIEQARMLLQKMDRQIRSVPEVARVFGKMGRADTATDPAPIGMAETTILLKPKSEWRAGLTKEDIVAELDQKLRFPGMPNLFWMPIQTRTEMLNTGVRSPVAVQIFGSDLGELERNAAAIEAILRTMPETRSASAERARGGFYLDVDFDRHAAAQLGVRLTDVQQMVRYALGGESIAETFEGRQRIPIQLRFPREYREDPEAIEALWVHTASGQEVPLSQVAHLQFRQGPPMIRSEEGQLTTYVFIDTAMATASYIEKAQSLLDSQLSLSTGVRYVWAGQYASLQRAEKTLQQVIPLTLLLVMVLLYRNTGSLTESLLVLCAVPFSLIGAIFLLHALDYSLSVAVWVGMIALMGLDAETGVVMLLYLKLSWASAEREGNLGSQAEQEAAILAGAAQRLRPKLMTVTTTMLGLLPLLWSQGTGADLMKRVAAPMVGGLMSSFVLELLVYPALFSLWKTRGFRFGEKRG